MLSVAAAAILTTTGAFAFDTNLDGLIVTSTVIDTESGQNIALSENYKPNDHFNALTEVTNQFSAAVPSDDNLTLSSTLFGDALIFPAIRQNDGWSSEVVVTNTSEDFAVVAKVVVYAANDSREYVDFNIYLSANDVFRFNIKDGQIVTGDDSIPADNGVYNPASGNANVDIPLMNEDSAMVIPFNNQGGKFGELDKGYVVVYGMAQADQDNNSTDGIKGLTFHKQHAELFTEYRSTLDDCRDHNSTETWRNAFTSTNMTNGMITSLVKAPNVAAACDDANNGAADFGNVEQILTGVVTISNDGADARELTLHATALANFTEDDKMVLWTEGEFAAIADRGIVVDDNGTAGAADGDAPQFVDATRRGYYSQDQIDMDANAFRVSDAYYSFKKDSLNTETLANTFLLTQPYKRTSVQLGNVNGYWVGLDTDDENGVNKPYGGFCKNDYVVYNDFEDDHETIEDPDDRTNITSPYDSNVVPPGCIMVWDEVATVADLQANTIHAETNGFVRIRFGEMNGLTTQQIGTKVNGQAQTSWVYAPAIYVAPAITVVP